MSSTEDFPDVIATTPDGLFRARIVPDLNAESPADSLEDFCAVFVPTHAGLRSRDIVATDRECDTAEAISEAIFRYGGATTAAVRYLRVMRGIEAVHVDLGVNRDYRPTLAAVDPKRAEPLAILPADYAEEIETDAALYRQWAVGDVWGAVVERAVIWERVGGDERMTTWEHCDATFGIYGEDDAREYARTFMAEVAAR